MTVHHLLEAEQEILDAVTFYKERARNIAAAFFAEFRKAREEIAMFPEFWKPVGGGYRRSCWSAIPTESSTGWMVEKSLLLPWPTPADSRNTGGAAERLSPLATSHHVPVVGRSSLPLEVTRHKCRRPA